MNFKGPLEDRVAIRELMDTYSDAVTRRDTHQWASVWLDSEECRWLLPSMAEWAQFLGKENIVREWTKMMNQFHGDSEAPNQICQVTTPGSIFVEGHSATARAYTTEFFVVPGGRTMHTKGQYDDVLVKCDGSWYFKERTWTMFKLGDYASIMVEKA